jgi:hypothetical protein
MDRRAPLVPRQGLLQRRSHTKQRGLIAAAPLAGAIFAIKTGIRGLLEPAFLA